MSKKHPTRISPPFGNDSPESKRNSRSFSLTDEGFISFYFEDNEAFYIVKDRKTDIPDNVECASMRARRKVS